MAHLSQQDSAKMARECVRSSVSQARPLYSVHCTFAASQSTECCCWQAQECAAIILFFKFSFTAYRGVHAVFKSGHKLRQSLMRFPMAKMYTCSHLATGNLVHDSFLHIFLHCYFYPHCQLSIILLCRRTLKLALATLSHTD